MTFIFLFDVAGLVVYGLVFGVQQVLGGFWFFGLLFCRNPSLWLATKAKGLQGCEPSSRPGRHITCSRECKECKECKEYKESRECEGVNPHTPK